MRAALLAVLAFAALPALAQKAPPIGAAGVGWDEAQRIYGAACLGTLPQFEGAADVLAAEGMARNPQTGTWYHPALNLSVQVDDACSMVFASGEATPTLGLALATLTAAEAGADAAREAVMGLDPATGSARVDGPGGSRMFFDPVASPDGQAYYRVVLEPGR